MTRLRLILLLTLAACTPAKQQNLDSYAFPSSETGSADSSTASAARSSEGLRLESVGQRVLAIAVALCGSLETGATPAQAGQPPETRDCNYPLVVSEESEANAFTDGRRVRITRRLVRFASSDAELAFTIAHEVAHNLLGHRTRTLFGDPKRLEYEADSLGLQLVARAGYDPRAAVKLLRRLASSDPGRDRPHPYYPSFSKRADVLQDLAEQVQLELSANPDKGLESLLTAIAEAN